MESHPDQTATIFPCVCRLGLKCLYMKQGRCWFRHDDGKQAWSACSTLRADEARLPERPMRSATSVTTTPREMWEPFVLGVLEKLEGHMTDVLAMLKDVMVAVSTKHVVDQCSADKKVEDPAGELKEMAEARAKAWQAETSAAEAWMAELKEFEESRMSSSGAEDMWTYDEIEAQTEERTHAGVVFPRILNTEHWLSMIKAKSSVRHAAMVTVAATNKQTDKPTNMELDGLHLAAMEEAKQMLKQHTESLKDLVAQSSRIGWARLSELEEKAGG